MDNQKERLLKIAKQKQLMYSWGTKFLAAFTGEKNRDKITKKYKKDQIKELMLEILGSIKQFYQGLKKESVNLYDNLEF